MGVTPFRYTGRRVILTFPDHETLAGLEIETAGMNLAGLMEIIRLTSGMDLSQDDGELSPSDANAVQVLLTKFVEAVKVWNLADENGNVVPVSIESLNALDLNDTMTIIGEWQERLAKVPTPLDRRPKLTERFPVESLPMEPL